jgi:2'-5' RNA ligase
MAQPLVVTLRLDSATEKLLTGLRTKYFPAQRNYLSAHITLFHALPADSLSKSVSPLLSSVTSQSSPFTVGLKAPFPLGGRGHMKGVGINIASHKLRKLHAEFLDGLKKEGVILTEQDSRELRPHVTLQNKVGNDEAERTLQALKSEFTEGTAKAEGIVVWRYEKGGEWTFLDEYIFRGGRGGGEDVGKGS